MRAACLCRRITLRTRSKKGSGASDGEDYVEIRYEGYAPGGVAVIVECLTDNKNRTAGNVRSIMTKHGGNLGETGAVGFMFDRIGEILYPADKADADTMFEAGVDAGAENVESDNDMHRITCSADDFAAVAKALEETFGEAEKAGLSWQANVESEVDASGAESVMKLIDALEDDDDVQTVTSNMSASEAIMEQLMEAAG